MSMGWGYTEPRPLRAWSKPTHIWSDQLPSVWALTCLLSSQGTDGQVLPDSSFSPSCSIPFL